MTTDTPTTPDPAARPLAVQAAELQGWTALQQVAMGDDPSVWFGVPAGAKHAHPMPRPDTDHGDALRLLEYVLSQPRVNSADLCGEQRTLMWTCFVSDIRSTPQETVDIASAAANTLPAAITLACIAALRALRQVAEAGTE